MTTEKKPFEDRWHRKHVGPMWDVIGAHQLWVMAAEGLRQTHHLLDYGCGSLRGGRFFAQYLLKGHYWGWEPVRKVLDHAMVVEVPYDWKSFHRPHLASSWMTLVRMMREQRMDYILAQSIFSHAGPATIGAMLQRFDAVLADDGVVVANYKQGEQEFQPEGWVYPGAVLYSEEELFEILALGGFECTPLPQHEHPNGLTWFRATRKRG